MLRSSLRRRGRLQPVHYGYTVDSGINEARKFFTQVRGITILGTRGEVFIQAQWITILGVGRKENPDYLCKLQYGRPFEGFS